MKKSLLTLTSAMAVSAAFALSPTLHPQPGAPRLSKKGVPALKNAVRNTGAAALNKGQNKVRAAASETMSMNWSYCQGAYMAVPTNYGEFKAAVELPAELTSSLAGAELSSISVASPVDASTARWDPVTGDVLYDNPIKDVEVWIATDIEKEPIIKVQGTLSESGFAWNEIQLTETYTITGDSPLFIGYTLDVPENENMYALVTDGDYPDNNYSCYTYSTYIGWDELGMPAFGDEYHWLKQGLDYGNLALRARISGDMLPVNDVSFVDWLMPSYAVPGEPFEVGVLVQNRAANPISEMTLTMEIEGMEPQNREITLEYGPIDYLETSVDWADFSCTTEGNNIAYKLYISKLNGETVDLSANAIEGYMLCIDNGYPRNQVFEEATGTWCGWCVLGYAGMEYMAENYAEDGFIGIGVHSSDPMASMDTADQSYYFFSDFVEGFPSAYLNRDIKNSIYPDPEEFEATFLDVVDLPAFASIEATLENAGSDRVLTLNTTTCFALGEENADYRVGYTVIEDEVGPYVQTNYCSGYPGEYYGFGDLDEYVPLVYNDVARNCSKPLGIENSVPATTVADEKYTYSTEIQLGDDVTDPARVRVVAMVINQNNGMIENACVVKTPAYSGVNTVSTSQQLSVAYGVKGAIKFRVNATDATVYSLDGRCVARNIKGNTLQLPAGIYIVSLNGNCVKVAVR